MQDDQGESVADDSLSAFVERVRAEIAGWIESEWQEKSRLRSELARESCPPAIAAIELRKATLSVETLAHRIDGMSEAALRRKLQHAGATHSPGEMIHRARMDYAARLLRERRYTIAAVATMSGFDDHRYCAARFREHFATSPRAFRRTTKANESTP